MENLPSGFLMNLYRFEAGDNLDGLSRFVIGREGLYRTPTEHTPMPPGIM
jgi:hypothetical protein